MTCYEFSVQIKELAKNGRYSEVLNLLKNNGANFIDEIPSNKYIVRDLLTSLRKAENGKYATLKMLRHFLQKYNIQINNDNMTNYGWFLYGIIRNIENNDIVKVNDEVMKFAKMIAPFLENDKYMLETFIAIFKESIKINVDKNHNFIIAMCENISPSLLSDSPNIINNAKILSDRESYYNKFARALYKERKYEQCVQVCKDALSNLKSFTNGTDIWIERYMLLSKNELDYPTKELVDEFEGLLKKKKDWFMQFDMAKLLQKYDKDKALKYAISAINNYGEIEKKIECLEFIGDILRDSNERLAKLHYLYVKDIRIKNEWKVSQTLNDKINAIKQEVGDNILGKLKEYWRQFATPQNIKNGVITKILHDNDKGKDGFIDKYYFNIPTNHKFYKSIALNAKVRFELLDKQGKPFAKILKILNI